MSKIRKSAKGEECQVRLAGICNFNPETTIFAHIGGGGMGAKMLDIFGSYCCSDCHDVIDGRVKAEISRNEVMLDFYGGVFRTQLILIDKGLLIIAEDIDK